VRSAAFLPSAGSNERSIHKDAEGNARSERAVTKAAHRTPDDYGRLQRELNE
jgi:hypothetical protein